MLWRRVAVLVGILSMAFFQEVVPAEEGENHSFTLEESIKVAMDRNWSIKAKMERTQQAEYVRRQARADFLPKLSTSYGYNRISDPRSIQSPSGAGQDFVFSSQDNYEWRSSLVQPVFTGFALISSYELAKLGIDQSELELELEKLDIVFQVKEAFFNVLIADVGIDVAEKDVEFRRSNLEVAKSFYEVGMVPVNDVLRAETELANAEQNFVTAGNAAKVARSAFNSVLSRPINDPVRLVPPDPIYQPEKGELEAYIDEALTNRPEMKLLNVRLLQVEQEARLAKSRYYPEISFEYDYVREGDSPDVSGSPFHTSPRWEAFAVASWTFWEWGKTYYAVKEKDSLMDEIMKTKLALEDSIRFEVKDAIMRLENAEENIPTTKKGVESGEENLRVNEERYKAQVTTITEVLDAQSLLTRARVNYYNALYNHNLAKARLMRAVGRY
jgi:outer membrane protein TolC